jgi:hypothetical protein
VRKSLRILAAAFLIAIGVAVLTLATTQSTASNRDFISYWAAGQQIAHHGNPYDAGAVLRLERMVGSTEARPLVMRNPPSSLFLALPLGYVSAKTGAVLWSLMLIGALMGSVRMLWIMQGRPADHLHLIAYVFPPAMACLLAGQVGILLLLGVVLFLYCIESRPYLAGSALLLCSLKPHLLLPFGVVLLAWMVARRAYQVAAGALIALSLSLASAFILDPHAWSHYAQLAKTAGVENEFIPVISTAFRLIVNRELTWLQFVPALFGCAWAARYFWRHRKHWNWQEHGSVLLLVSVTVAPYAWFTDESVLLPAILFGLYRVSDAGRSLIPFGCIAGIALVEVVAVVPLASGFYIWTAPAWLLWYVSSIHNPGRSIAESVNLVAPAA